MSRRTAEKKYTSTEERIAYKNRVKRSVIANAERKRLRNRRVMSALRTAVKKARFNIAAQSADALESVLQAVSLLDKAAKKGVIKKRTANRNKSRLMKQYHLEIVSAEAAEVSG